MRLLRKKPVSHNGDTGGGESTVDQEVTPLQHESEALSEKGRSPSATPASMSTGDGTKRARTSRTLTVVSTQPTS